MSELQEFVEEILEEHHGDRVYSVEDSVVWVSGMNANCTTVAERMAKTLMKYDIACGLVHDDDADRYGGVEFNYGKVDVEAVEA